MHWAITQAITTRNKMYRTTPVKIKNYEGWEWGKDGKGRRIVQITRKRSLAKNWNIKSSKIKIAITNL